MFHELHLRTTLKSLTWLVVAFSVTWILLVLIGDDWRSAAWHAAVIQLIKFAFFYIHERVWNRSNFGQKLREQKL